MSKMFDNMKRKIRIKRVDGKPYLRIVTETLDGEETIDLIGLEQLQNLIEFYFREDTYAYITSTVIAEKSD